MDRKSSVGIPKTIHLAVDWHHNESPLGGRSAVEWRWGDELVLRADAGAWDIGYPRTVQRPDGKIVTVYYYNDAPDQERYIGATIWDPGKAK